MSLLTVAVAAGGACGLGVLVTARELLPRRPDLVHALARLDQPPTASTSPAAGTETTADGIRRWVAARMQSLPVPHDDLRLLDRPVERHLTSKAVFAVLGLLLPAALLSLLMLLGLGIPLAVPVFVPIAGALAFFFVPDLVLRGQADEARADFRKAVAAYLELVALERAADGGPADSLERAAKVGHGWAFTRISDTLARARLVGVTPWAALSALAGEVGAEDLRDLADIVAVAGEEGAAIYDTLAAKAASLRARALAEAEAEANAASEKLTLPAVCLGLAFLLLVCYPAFARILI